MAIDSSAKSQSDSFCAKLNASKQRERGFIVAVFVEVVVLRQRDLRHLLASQC